MAAGSAVSNSTLEAAPSPWHSTGSRAIVGAAAMNGSSFARMRSTSHGSVMPASSQRARMMATSWATERIATPRAQVSIRFPRSSS